jgi:hypothetical protein
MRREDIEQEIEIHMAVLRGAASQQDYDRARAALLILREALEARKSSSDSDYPFSNWDIPK